MESHKNPWFQSPPTRYHPHHPIAVPKISHSRSWVHPLLGASAVDSHQRRARPAQRSQKGFKFFGSSEMVYIYIASNNGDVSYGLMTYIWYQSIKSCDTLTSRNGNSTSKHGDFHQHTLGFHWQNGDRSDDSPSKNSVATWHIPHERPAFWSSSDS